MTERHSSASADEPLPSLCALSPCHILHFWHRVGLGRRDAGALLNIASSYLYFVVAWVQYSAHCSLNNQSRGPRERSGTLPWGDGTMFDEGPRCVMRLALTSALALSMAASPAWLRTRVKSPKPARAKTQAEAPTTTSSSPVSATTSTAPMSSRQAASAAPRRSMFPLTISVISSAVLRSQRAVDLIDAVRNTAGVSSSAVGPVAYNNLTIRGIAVDTPQQLQARRRAEHPVLDRLPARKQGPCRGAEGRVARSTTASRPRPASST